MNPCKFHYCGAFRKRFNRVSGSFRALELVLKWFGGKAFGINDGSVSKLNVLLLSAWRFSQVQYAGCKCKYAVFLLRLIFIVLLLPQWPFVCGVCERERERVCVHAPLPAHSHPEATLCG